MNNPASALPLTLIVMACNEAANIAPVAASYAVYKRLRYYEMRRNPESVQAARLQRVKHKLEQ